MEGFVHFKWNDYICKKISDMISKRSIQDAISTQCQSIGKKKSYTREALKDMPFGVKNYALIITGIRRCGKSTLLEQLMESQAASGRNILYLNFDVPALYGFTFDSFQLLDMIIEEKGYKTLFFDEIQVVEGWEVYVRSKLESGFEVVITGSNASLLSRELGTKLTGRHIDRELFPFSFSEFCGFKSMVPSSYSLAEYLNLGGFPAFLETQEPAILGELVNDIIYRDIAVRYGINDENTLKMCFSLLLSNFGGLISASKLKQQLGVKSTTTITDYLSFFRQTYLLDFIPKFSFSAKAQVINPKKVYCVDTGILSVVNKNFSENAGKKLENAVYAELRRKNKEIFYYSNALHECDFILANSLVPHTAVQVCYKLTPENLNREVSGLVFAMDELNIGNGVIITFDDEDTIVKDGKTIEVVPFYKYFAS